MLFPIKKLIYVMIFNLSLFLLLIIGIQNSSTKRKVNFITRETIDLPISFIIGISFISGSITGSLFNINSVIKNKKL